MQTYFHLISYSYRLIFRWDYTRYLDLRDVVLILSSNIKWTHIASKIIPRCTCKILGGDRYSCTCKFYLPMKINLKIWFEFTITNLQLLKGHS